MATYSDTLGRAFFLMLLAVLSGSVGLWVTPAFSAECSGPEDCAQICQQQQDQLNATTAFGQTYVCNMFAGTQVIVLDDPENEAGGGDTHTNYTCNCVSYLQVDGGSIGDGIGRKPGTDLVPPYLPQPPGDGGFVPGNPYTECMQKALESYDQCIAHADRLLVPGLSDIEETKAKDKVNEERATCRTDRSNAENQCRRLHARWIDKCVFCVDRISRIKIRK